MAGRGVNVGNAYVDITADGRGINEEIVDSVEEAGPDVKKAGKQHGEDYGDEFGDSLRVKFSHAADGAGAELNRRLSDSADDTADDYGVRFEKRMKKMSKRIGNSIGKSLGKEITESLEGAISRIADVSGNGGGGSGGRPSTPGGAGNNSVGDDQKLISTSMEWLALYESKRIALHKAANDAIEKDDNDLVKRQQKLFDKIQKDHERSERKQEDDRRKAFNAGGKAQIKFWADVERTRIAAEKRIEKNRRAAFEAGAKAQIAFWADVEKTRIQAEKRIKSEALKQDAELWRVRNATAKAHYKYLADLEKGRITKKGVDIPGGGRKTDLDIGAKIGGMLGAGSRNNFLNFFGKSLGNIIGLVDKVRTGAGSMFSTFAKGWKEAGDGASLLQKALGGGGAVGKQIGGGLLSVAKAGPAAAAAIVVVVVAMSAMVSVASALLALVVALTSAIVSALTGALLVLGGAFVAAAAAGGLLAAAFLSMNDAQKKLLAESFKPLKKELTDLGQLMIRDMVPYFKSWGDNLSRAISHVTPLAEVMGDAFGRSGEMLTRSLGGKGFQTFITAMTRDLPAISKNFSAAFGSALNGVMGIFGALSPLVKQFSEYVRDAADRFNDWANSAGGQNAIVDFANRAVESLKSVWKFAKQFFGFISDLLFSKDSQKAGNTLFDSLADSFEGFRKKLNKAIKNGDLKKWFDDAIEFGGKMKKVIIQIKDAFVKLDNSGVLDAVGDAFVVMADVIEAVNKVLGPLVDFLGMQMETAVTAAEAALNGFSLGGILGTLGGLIGALQTAVDLFHKLPGGGGNSGLPSAPAESGGGGSGGGGSWRVIAGGPPVRRKGGKSDSIDGTKAGWAESLQEDAGRALAKRSGGGGGDGKGKWHNPFVKWALSLIKNGPPLALQLTQAMTRMFDQVSTGLTQASKALDLEQARSILTAQFQAFRQTGVEGVRAAQDAINSAASGLANASSKKEAMKYLAQVKKAQKDMKHALDNQKRLNAAAALLDAQKKQNNAGALGLIGDTASVAAITALSKVQNKTLADFAASRAKAALLIEDAKSQLSEAISLRDTYTSSTAEAAKQFANLTTAQASVIDGVEQTLNATDITTNLQTRLAKIQAFQNNLRILLANGLSNEAYKQIVDAGVEGGSAYAEALVSGGAGAVGMVNGLVGQIGAVSDQLGLEAGTRMYQAGVDAAQGLVDGLTSLSAQLDSAAAALGLSIAKAIKKALGIHSPSRVMFDAMGFVGDGLVQGLDAQQPKVGTAANRLSGVIAVSPEVAQYAARQGTSPVSGNPMNDIDITVVTPTEDPHSVAMEVLNEVTGRLV